MGLQEKLDAYKKDFVAKAPQAALDVMHRATEDLRQSGILLNTVQVGQVAPDFALKNTENKTIALNDLLDRGPVVLSFYRGIW